MTTSAPFPSPFSVRQTPASLPREAGWRDAMIAGETMLRTTRPISFADDFHVPMGTLIGALEELKKPCPHRWTGQQVGGPPDMAESTEWVEYCAECGEEQVDE